jgi:DNA-3-methyladenine glycosylase II
MASIPLISDSLLADAEAHLAERDVVMAELILTHGRCTIGQRRRDPFHVLCSAIISQQLSVKAAETIQARVMQAAGARQRLRPAQLLLMDQQMLRACGLSNAKARWLLDLAGRTQRREFSFTKLASMADEEAIEALDALPGIGRWTAEMYLMFALHRLDLFSLGDVGLRRGINLLYANGRPLSERRTLQISRRWAPYRSIASWYLWRAVEAPPPAATAPGFSSNDAP